MIELTGIIKARTEPLCLLSPSRVLRHFHQVPLVAVTLLKRLSAGFLVTKLILVSDVLAVEEPLEVQLGYGTASARHIKSISVTMREPRGMTLN